MPEPEINRELLPIGEAPSPGHTISGPAMAAPGALAS
jgi:hypothetical protein